MNCLHAIMSIKLEFERGLNECVFSVAGLEIISVNSLTEYIQRQSVKGIPAIHSMAVSMLDLRESHSSIWP